MTKPKLLKIVRSFLVLFSLSGCATTSYGPHTGRFPAQSLQSSNEPSVRPSDQNEDSSHTAQPEVLLPENSPNYPRIFFQVREALRKEKDGSRRSKKDLAEIPIIETIQKNPKLLDETRENVLAAVSNESQLKPDPTKHLRLVPPPGEWGYSELKVFSTHPYYSRLNNSRRIIKASDAVQVWSDFLSLAKKEIILNVFDFDLMNVAHVLIERVQAGVKVWVGIDKNTIASRPEVKEVYDLLASKGVSVTPVNSVSLNHQKVAAIDWSDLNLARVLFSSGNLTQSCLGPEGDLVDIPAKKRPSKSVPNANHVVTMKSWLLAVLVHHELTKTLDPQFQYRGSDYPTTGSFQITGPGVDPNTLEAYPDPSLVISFSPGGAYRSINKNLIAHFIKNSTGRIRMSQFAYSSKEVADALRERAANDFQQKGKFDFKSVGDTPFAVQYWSQFLKMSGLESVTLPSGMKSYELSTENGWIKSLSQKQLDSLRKSVRIAPIEYGTHSTQIDGKKYKYTAKIHHKILSTGPYAIAATSFNFSEGAETNNEQILVFRDPIMLDYVEGATDWLFARSPRSVFDEAMRRKARNDVSNNEDGDTPTDSISRSIKEQ